jgi:hypothetical protein
MIHAPRGPPATSAPVGVKAYDHADYQHRGRRPVGETIALECPYCGLTGRERLNLHTFEECRNRVWERYMSLKEDTTAHYQACGNPMAR